MRSTPACARARDDMRGTGSSHVIEMAVGVDHRRVYESRSVPESAAAAARVASGVGAVAGTASAASTLALAARERDAGQDQHQAGDRGRRDLLVEQHRAVGERQRRDQVPAQRGAPGAGLGDQREVEDERDRGADHAEAHDGRDLAQVGAGLAERRERRTAASATAATAQAAKLTTSGGTPAEASAGVHRAQRRSASAAPTIASAPRNSPVLWTVSTPISSTTPAKPITSPIPPRRSTRSVGSISGASSAMNSGPGEISTPVSPEEICVSPKADQR